MGPADLDLALCGVDLPHDPNVITGFRGSEDAGVYRLDDSSALVQTVDFFTPVVDDPKIFGQVAAVNSLSDVYAMGGRPLTAMNIVCFPVKKLGIAVLRSILEGGLEALREAGVALVGGHSVEDEEPKYGLSVTGLVHPDRVMANSSLRPGDALVLTKAIGTGLIVTTMKAQLASPGHVQAVIASMCSLNRTASEVAARFGVRACTDVTGFGLAGHLVEMARASRCSMRIRAGDVPVLDGAMDAAAMGLVPAGARSNHRFFSTWTTIDSDMSPEMVDLVFDPQTSGGLIMGIPSDRATDLVAALHDEGVEVAAVIGDVYDAHLEGQLEIT